MSNKCSCCFDSQFAYILDNVDNVNTEKYKINIKDYINDEKIQEDVKNKLKFLRCEENNELIKYVSTKKKSHFKHKSDLINNGMLEWHIEWQSHFEYTEVICGNGRADAMVGNIALEFQHSRIDEEEVENRSLNYVENGKNVFWIIDCNESIEITEDNNIFTIEFKKDIWKYDNFISQDVIYLNIEDKIIRIDPNKVKSNMINVKEMKSKNEFIDSIKKNENIWKLMEDTIQCTLYHNQRGAGCGKTYESIQLLEKDERFKNKNIFIYLTKMHSAKEVIYNELKEQSSRGAISLNPIEEKEYTYGKNKSKQYKFTYENKNRKKCTIIIGTIDSYIYSIGDKKVNDRNYFFGLVKSIRNGYVDVTQSGLVKYAQQYVKLNKKSMIIVDEAQDLEPEYVEALSKIMEKTYMDVYIIGDKLQSIWREHNIHTMLEHNNIPNVKIERNTGINQILRFHNIQFIDFVNKIIDFGKYNLPCVEKICENLCCKYKHEDTEIPYHKFFVPPIYADDTDENKINGVIDNIIEYMENEIKKNNYLPNNFMFIFPILKKNKLASMLESKLQNFWIEKFKDVNYQSQVVINDKYWKKYTNDNLFHKYVYFHKSSEGKSINLKESENATRILSIHASKGNGCEVVFLLGLNERVLTIYSKQKCNIIYDSLLHVAITRQKKSLYIGLNKNGDEICKRFKICEFENKEEAINKNLYISKYVKLNKIISHVVDNEELFEKINNQIIVKNDYEKLLPNDDEQSDIIDWGHHVIRMCVFKYYILFNIINNEKIDNQNNGDQFKEIMRKISIIQIVPTYYNEYYNMTKRISEKRKNYEEVNEIPLLFFDDNDNSHYSKYKEIIIDFMKNIQKKIKNSLSKNKLPLLCPMETVILMHMIQMKDNGIYAETSIMDIYNIIYCYDECSMEINNDHIDKYECMCKNFDGNINNPESIKYTEIRKSIKHHYEKIKKIEELYDNYKNIISEKYEDINNFKYLIDHNIYFGNNSGYCDFKICDKNKLIAYSENYVIIFIIKPQFNKMNFNDIIVKCLMKNYMLFFCSDEQNKKISNRERFENKKIITCIFTFDSDIPIVYEFNLNKNNNILYECINKSIFDEYSQYHDEIFNNYMYHKKREKNIDEVYKKLLIKEKIPNYVCICFENIKNQLKKQKENAFDIFSTEINNCLNKALESFISIDDYESSDNNT